MSINALLVPILETQMWYNCKPDWKASSKEQNQIFNNTLKKDVFCQQRTRLSFGHIVLLAV